MAKFQDIFKGPTSRHINSKRSKKVVKPVHLKTANHSRHPTELLSTTGTQGLMLDILSPKSYAKMHAKSGKNQKSGGGGAGGKKKKSVSKGKYFKHIVRREEAMPPTSYSKIPTPNNAATSKAAAVNGGSGFQFPASGRA